MEGQDQGRGEEREHKKRRLESPPEPTPPAAKSVRARPKPMCWYGYSCFRKADPSHDQRFSHPASPEEERAYLQQLAEEEAQKRAALEAEESLYALPEGWVRMEHEPSGGLVFYLHQPSGVISWTRPYVVRDEVGAVAQPSQQRTHEIPLHPFSLILQLSDLLAHAQQRQRMLEYVTEGQRRLEALARKLDAADQGSCAEAKEEHTKEKEQGKESEAQSEASPNSVPFPGEAQIAIPPMLEHSAASPPSPSVVPTATMMEKAMLRLLESAAKGARPTHKEAQAKQDQRQIRAKRKQEKGPESGIPGIPEAVLNNIAVKSPVCALLDYCLSQVRVAPDYVTSFQEDSERPYVTTVRIGGIEYGSGACANKKESKHLAAKAALSILCPAVLPLLNNSFTVNKHPDKDPHDLSVTDPEVVNLANAKQPHQILTEFSQKKRLILHSTKEEIKPQESKQTSQFKVVLTMGDMRAEGIAKNLSIAKNRAAQHMLQQIHPEAKSWGHILDLYAPAKQGATAQAKGKRQVRKQGEKDNPESATKQEEAQAIRDIHAQPNFQLLEQLKQEMRRFASMNEGI